MSVHWQGIAVGMATNIPPHNLVEVVSGLKALIDDPDISLAQLMTHIPGPDFPTGIPLHNSAITPIYRKFLLGTMQHHPRSKLPRSTPQPWVAFLHWVVFPASEQDLESARRGTESGLTMRRASLDRYSRADIFASNRVPCNWRPSLAGGPQAAKSSRRRASRTPTRRAVARSQSGAGPSSRRRDPQSRAAAGGRAAGEAAPPSRSSSSRSCRTRPTKPSWSSMSPSSQTAAPCKVGGGQKNPRSSAQLFLLQSEKFCDMEELRLQQLSGTWLRAQLTETWPSAEPNCCQVYVLRPCAKHCALLAAAPGGRAPSRKERIMACPHSKHAPMAARA